MGTLLDTFKISNKIVVITGGAGLLGKKHAETVAEAQGIPVLLDINRRVTQTAKMISNKYRTKSLGLICDITNQKELQQIQATIQKKYKQVDILINNAANNPQVKKGQLAWSRLENFPLEVWQQDISVGLTGAFLCSQVFGREMAKRGKGVILNIASDLGVIAPDQRIYRKPGVSPDQQPVKPVTYSVIKHGLIGLTKYLATYWAQQGVRVNSLSPGGVYNNQPPAFVKKLTNLIPLARMADHDEYKAAILFLISNASSYMTGANLIIDGGRTVW